MKEIAVRENHQDQLNEQRRDRQGLGSKSEIKMVIDIDESFEEVIDEVVEEEYTFEYQVKDEIIYVIVSLDGKEDRKDEIDSDTNQNKEVLDYESLKFCTEIVVAPNNKLSKLYIRSPSF